MIAPMRKDANDPTHGDAVPEASGRRVIIAPSVLSADFGALADGVRQTEAMGGDFVHLDVMDGCFVPNITFGPKAVTDLRPVSQLPFDVHLMICGRRATWRSSAPPARTT